MNGRRYTKPTLCRDWPNCSCGDRYDWFRYDFDPFPDPPFTPDEIADLKADIVFLLACTVRHCPDPRYRRHAMVQLMQPVFADMAKDWIN